MQSRVSSVAIACAFDCAVIPPHPPFTQTSPRNRQVDAWTDIDMKTAAGGLFYSELAPGGAVDWTALEAGVDRQAGTFSVALFPDQVPWRDLISSTYFYEIAEWQGYAIARACMMGSSRAARTGVNTAIYHRDFYL